MPTSRARRTRNRLPVLDPLPPHPSGRPLQVTIDCSTSPDGTGATSHPVTIASDWSVSTPHDLEAERVAAAFGGYLSCLHLVDTVVPAVADLLQAFARRLVPKVKRGARGAWRVESTQAAPCCRPTSTAQAAAAHLRSIAHVGTRVGTAQWLAAALAEQVLAAHRPAGSFTMPPNMVHRTQRCVRGEQGHVALWDAGLHPVVVTAVHDEVVGSDGPALPEALYLGVVARRPDLAWLSDTLASASAAVEASPTAGELPELAEWLAWTQTPLDRRDRQSRACWIASGVPRSWITDLSSAGYRHTDAERLARATGRSISGAAEMLLSWHHAGCRPDTDDLVDLYAIGLSPWYEPSRPAIARLRGRLGPLMEHFTTTELGLMLALEGTVPDAERMLRAQAGRVRGMQRREQQQREECA